MPALSRLGAIALAALSLAGAVAADGALQNDAGTGADASDRSADPTMLAAWGNYTGAIAPEDRDWFAVATPEAAGSTWCAQASGSGDTLSWLWLGLQTPSGDRRVAALLGNAPRLFVAGYGPTRTLVGVDPVTRAESDQAVLPGPYRLSIQGGSLPVNGDAGTGRDAGSVLDGALAIASGCTTGRLDPLNGLGDTTDAFVFQGSKDQQIVYSLGAASSALTASLGAANGSWSAPTIGSNGLATARLPADGSYQLTVVQASGASTVSYLLGVVGIDPGGPCRPSCGSQ